MPAYVIFDIEITDPTAYDEYRKLAAVAGAKFSPKRVLTTGGTVEQLEGDWSPHRLVVLEFESVEKAREWYYSPEYQQAVQVRQRTSRSKGVIVESA